MYLDLDRIPPGRSELGIAGQVELGLGEGRAPETTLSGALTLQNLESRVLATGTLQASGTAECARCLAAFPLTWEVPVELMVLRDTHSDETEGETLLIMQRDGEVDLAEALRECAAVAYPQATVCREDCRGLCASCGADLNDGPCGCVEEPVDPRWSDLP
jgi:uncharacterized protein